MLPLSSLVDAESAAITYLMPLLAADFPDVQISNRGSGARFVRVRRVGGVELSPNHDRPQLDVIVWHDSDKTRMQLAMSLWLWLRAANNDVAGDAVVLYASTTLGPRQLPDPADSTKTVCMFTVELITRAA